MTAPRLPAYQWPLVLLAFSLYLSWPWRSLYYYKLVAAHEGFGTTADAFIIGVAHELIAMILFAPIAIMLFWMTFKDYPGRKSLFDFNRRSKIWSSIVTGLMLLLILEKIVIVLYLVQYPHHWLTILIDLATLYLLLCMRVSLQYSRLLGLTNRHG